MSIAKLKTKFTTGAWLTDVKHYFKKINEIIDYLNNSTALYNTKVHLTTAQILSGFSTPLLMIEAPGVGKAIELISASFKLTVLTTPFSNSGLTSYNVGLRLETSSELQGVITDAINVPVSIFGRFDLYGSAAETLIENKALFFEVGELDAGDGNADVYICYRIIDL